MLVLVINSGSSSVKFELFDLDAAVPSLLDGEVERIGSPNARRWIERDGERHEDAVAASDHGEAFTAALASIVRADVDLDHLAVVGHRVVHGGSRFSAPVIIDDAVVSALRDLELLAPLHTHANLLGIEAARAALHEVPQIAVFDTCFHRTMPPRAREYALPRELARAHGIRRYGFHGVSHEYVAGRAAHLLDRSIAELDLISLHLGNGASACAIHAGESVDTSMGMTPLEGLVMGTRCGDVDPAVPMLLGEITGRSREDVHRLLNHESGLLGLCGESDLRAVHARADAGDTDAQEALELYCYRVKKYVGAYYAVLGRLDALVFTAGVGENDARVRDLVCAGLSGLGIEIDPALNTADDPAERAISPEGAPVAVLVIPTDEEREIARRAVACLTASSGGSAL